MFHTVLSNTDSTAQHATIINLLYPTKADQTRPRLPRLSHHRPQQERQCGDKGTKTRAMPCMHSSRSKTKRNVVSSSVHSPRPQHKPASLSFSFPQHRHPTYSTPLLSLTILQVISSISHPVLIISLMLFLHLHNNLSYCPGHHNRNSSTLILANRVARNS